jgi:vacuolar-type H+-ATPase catalytic subunit A/Vma1
MPDCRCASAPCNDARPRESGDDGVGSYALSDGCSVSALDRTRRWHCQPVAGVVEGFRVVGGAPLGIVYDGPLVPSHVILVPPDVSGVVVAAHGSRPT